MLEAASALVEATRKKTSNHLLNHFLVPLTWLRRQKVLLQLIQPLFENEEEKALAEAVESLVLSGTASQQFKQLFALSPVIDAFFENTYGYGRRSGCPVKNRLAILSQLTKKAAKLARLTKSIPNKIY